MLSPYNPLEVTIIYGGLVVTGVSATNFLEIQKVKPKRSYKTGVAGELFTYSNQSSVVEITFRVLQNSEANKFFNLLQNVPYISEILTVVDASGGHNMVFSNCTVIEESSYVFGKEGVDRSWKLVGEMTISLLF